jgi:hypothetical protein
LKEPKITSRASWSNLSLTDQRILQIQAILIDFIQNHVIKIVN